MFLLGSVSFVGCSKNKISSVIGDLTNYTLNLDFNSSNNILTGTEDVNYVNSTDVALKQLCFHLYPNAFSEKSKIKPVSSSNKQKAYPNGESVGNINVKTVKVEGVSQDVIISDPYEQILIVSLQNELYPNERVNINISFEVLLPNCLHRFGYGDNTYNFGNFYPIASIYENGDFCKVAYGSNGDPFYSEMANYNVKLSYENDFVLASTGKQLETVFNNDNKKVTTISANAVRDFAFVLSKKFKVITGKADNTTVYYYYYDDEFAEKNLQAGIDAIKTFNNIFGKYPYETYSIAKTNFIHGGMEFPNLVFISDSVEPQKEYLNVIVHETAHQWWYNLVGSNACEFAWLDEGLTEYSTLLFYKNNPSYEVDVKESLNSSLSSYLLYSEICTSVYGKFDSVMTKNVNEFKGDLDYVYVTYVKGVLFFENLNDLVGDKNFAKAIKLYFNENCYKNARPENLISAFERTCKRSLESFFDSWINGKVILQNYK